MGQNLQPFTGTDCATAAAIRNVLDFIESHSFQSTERLAIYGTFQITKTHSNKIKLGNSSAVTCTSNQIIKFVYQELVHKEKNDV